MAGELDDLGAWDTGSSADFGGHCGSSWFICGGDRGSEKGEEDASADELSVARAFLL